MKKRIGRSPEYAFSSRKQGASLSQHINGFADHDAPPSFRVQFFHWRFIPQTWLTESWAAWLTSSSSPAPLSRGQTGSKSQSSTWLVFWWPGPILNPLINKSQVWSMRLQKHSYTWEILRILEAHCQDSGTQARHILYCATKTNC